MTARQKDRLLWWLVALVVLAVWLFEGWWHSAAAHPGRLDADGCHTVRHEYAYVDGRRAPEGSRHCHRIFHPDPAVGIRLDGTEVLQDDRHDHGDLVPSVPFDLDAPSAVGSP